MRTHFSFALIEHVTPHFYFDVADGVGLPSSIPIVAGLFCPQFFLEFLFESISFVLVVHLLEDVVPVVKFFLVSSLDYGNDFCFLLEGLQFDWDVANLWEL